MPLNLLYILFIFSQRKLGMLDLLRGDILTLIFSNITAPKDYLNASMTCKNVQRHLRTQCTDVVFRLYHNPSLGFLKHMQALKHVSIFRKYDSFLDFTPLAHLRELKTIFVNNTENTCNVPVNPLLFFGDDKLIAVDPLPYFSDCEEGDVDDGLDDIMNAKEYFCRRFKHKKFTKIKYREKTFRMKTRHIVGSV